MATNVMYYYVKFGNDGGESPACESLDEAATIAVGHTDARIIRREFKLLFETVVDPEDWK